MKFFKIALIGLLVSTAIGCKPSLCEPNASEITCDFPKQIGAVNDYCDFLNAEERQQLEQTIADFKAKTGTEIIIVIEDSKRSHSKKFHTGCIISKKWDLQKPENCDDIIITISRKRNFIDIAYGETVRGILTPEDHKNILFKNMVPSFNKKRFYEGLNLGIGYMISHLEKQKTKVTAI